MTKTEIIQLSAVTDAGMLRDAAKLVKRGWTRAYSGRDEDGNGVGYDKPNAVCFCAQGAVYRAVMDGLGGEQKVIFTNLFEETVDRLGRYVIEAIEQTDGVCPKRHYRERPEYVVVEWNDRWVSSQDDVVAVLEKAATLALATADTTKDERD